MTYRSILLFGAPGSGKGTQGQILGRQPGFYHCACGDVFRSLDRSSPMGKIFAEYSRSGSLVPDELTVELWRQTIAQRAAAGIFDPQRDVLLLDGIPRTAEQAALMRDDIDVAAVIYLVCHDVSQIIERLRRRATVENRVDDTNEDVIRYRMDVYEEQTRPVLAFYPRSRIFRINATQALEKVTAEVLEALSSLRK